jgi:hypothetical protein
MKCCSTCGVVGIGFAQVGWSCGYVYPGSIRFMTPSR